VSSLLDRLLAHLVAGLLRLFALTWRVRLEGPDPFAGGHPFVAVTWHRGLFLAAATHRDRGLVVPVSRSRDGDRIDAVLHALGFGPSPRGSSSRGATSALRGMIRSVRSGHSVAILCDGPRGPARRAKPGFAALARVTGAPVVPVSLSARPALRFGSWDRVVLGLPFARVVVVYGEPLGVPKECDEDALERVREQVEGILERMTDELDARLGLVAGPRPLARGSGD
jgi:lysophospholipid acyltransferase (LPLAT)-like uncharacterized protein